MVPAAWRFLMMARAMDPFTLYFSASAARVMTRILGISVCIFCQRFSSRKTSLLRLSFTFTLVHDFFFVGSIFLVRRPLPSFPLSLPLASLPPLAPDF